MSPLARQVFVVPGGGGGGAGVTDGDKGDVSVSGSGSVWTVDVGGALKPTYQDHGNAGSTETINFATAGTHRIVLDANCVLAWAGAVNGVLSEVRLIAVQNATPPAGGWTLNFTSAVKWANALVPTPSGGANDVDVYSLFTVDGGTTIYGFMAGMDMS